MKLKLFLIATVFFSTIVYSNAENNSSDRTTYFGPKFGLDVVSNTSSITSLQNQLKGNFQVGGFLQIGKTFFVQPELYYASYTTNQTTSSKINFLKAPLMVGYKLFDIGLVSLNVNGGPSYLKLIDSTEKGIFNWEAGIGVGILGFITTDLRYTFKKGSTNGITQIQDLLTNGGVLNLTVGLKL